MPRASKMILLFSSTSIHNYYAVHVISYIYVLIFSVVTKLWNRYLMGQEWTEAPSIPSALVSMLLRLPKLRFVIVTLGENGCIMLERITNGEF